MGGARAMAFPRWCAALAAIAHVQCSAAWSIGSFLEGWFVQPSAAPAPSFAVHSPAAQAARTRGERVFEDLAVQRAESSCFLRAFQSAHADCGRMMSAAGSEAFARKKKFLAYSLARCHLADTAFPVGESCAEDRVPDCLRELSAAQLSTYTAFFTTIDSLCYFLHGELWHQRLEDGTLSLMVASEAAAAKLSSLRSAISESSEHLRETVSRVDARLNASMVEMAAAAEERERMAAERDKVMARERETMMLHLREVKGALLTARRGWAWLRAIGALSLYWLVAYLVTSVPATRGARSPLFLLASAVAVLEHLGGADPALYLRHLAWLPLPSLRLGACSGACFALALAAVTWLVGLCSARAPKRRPSLKYAKAGGRPEPSAAAQTSSSTAHPSARLELEVAASIAMRCNLAAAYEEMLAAGYRPGCCNLDGCQCES